MEFKEVDWTTKLTLSLTICGHTLAGKTVNENAPTLLVGKGEPGNGVNVPPLAILKPCMTSANDEEDEENEEPAT